MVDSEYVRPRIIGYTKALQEERMEVRESLIEVLPSKEESYPGILVLLSVLTNDIRAMNIKIAEMYQFRWRIEDYYLDIKDNPIFGQYQAGYKKHKEALALNMVHTFLVFSQAKGSFRHFIEVKAATMGELIRSFW